MLKLGILGSTRGTDMLAIIDAIEQKKLHAEISLVISNKADAVILQRAADKKIKTHYVDPKQFTKENYDQKLSELFLEQGVNVIILIGYMRILTKEFVGQWQNKIINVHPSLLPQFAGGMDQNVHQAVLDSGVKETGCTVHIVTETVDAGPILLQKTCSVLPGDTVESLKIRVQQLEGKALVEVLQKITDRDLFF